MQLRDYQSEACSAAWDFLKAKQGNPLIVLPTGSGKSLVIAELCRAAVKEYDGRVIVLQHRKELIEQNAGKVRRLLSVPIGLYSAGLNRKQINEPVIMAGIQSCYSKALEFGRRHLVIIDEAHLTPKSGDGMFRQFLLELAELNPGLKLIGLTATPYRTSEGHLCSEGSMWSKVCYEAQIRELIAKGYLCPVTNKPNETRYDTSQLHVRGGEFIESELQGLFGDDNKIVQACEEIRTCTNDRHSVIVFCSGVQHAEKVSEVLGGSVVHGGTPPLERAGILEAFKLGQIKYLCNVDVLTTGFDSPNIDGIAILRATMSAGLFVQMVGRGFRMHEEKKDCLVLDFGGNIERHGPIDAIDYGRAKRIQIGVPGDAPSKKCPGCDCSMATGTRVCECGFEFPEPELKHDEIADTAATILSEPETFEVTDWAFTRHIKKNADDAPNTLRVSYIMAGNVGKTIEEWVCLLHDGFAGDKAQAWWEHHCDDNLDDVIELMNDAYGTEHDRIDAAMSLRRDGQVKMPTTITARREGRWWRIVSRGPVVLPAPMEELPF